MTTYEQYIEQETKFYKTHEKIFTLKIKNVSGTHQVSAVTSGEAIFKLSQDLNIDPQSIQVL